MRLLTEKLPTPVLAFRFNIGRDEELNAYSSQLLCNATPMGLPSSTVIAAELRGILKYLTTIHNCRRFDFRTIESPVWLMHQIDSYALAETRAIPWSQGNGL